MEPKRTKLGASIATVIVVAVIVVTFANQKKPAAQNTVASDTGSANALPEQSSSQNQQSAVSPSNSYGEDDANGEEDGSSGNSVPTKTTTPVASTPVNTNKNSSSAYKDGTYTAVGNYYSPGGPDQLGVTLTIKNDVVTASSLNEMPGDNRSARYQSIFAANYKQYVIGQNISNLYLNKISSSSLTPQGFNDAVTQIKSQAKA